MAGAMRASRETTAGRARTDGAAPDRTAIDQQIDDNLRRIYQQALEEEIPDHLKQLLERLREQDAR